MTSNFVRQIHLKTARQLHQRGASQTELMEHFQRVGFSDKEVTQLMTDLIGSAFASTPFLQNQIQTAGHNHRGAD